MKLFKTILTVLLLAALTACNLDYLTSAMSATSNSASELHYTWNADKTIMYCYNTKDVLQWYEKYTYDSAGQKLTAQHFNARDVLQWSDAWQYNASGCPTLSAHYNASDALVMFTVYRYEAGKLSQTEVYDGSSVLQEVDQTIWTGDKPSQKAGFDGSLALLWATTYSYDAAGRILDEKSYDKNQKLSSRLSHGYDDQGREIRQDAWGDQGVVSANRTASGDASRTLAVPGPRGLTLPAVPAAPALPSLSLVDVDLTKSWVRNWLYDSYGYTALARLADNYPVNLVRSDSRLAKKLDTTLSWEATSANIPTVGTVNFKRITEKKTKYGSDVALDLKLGYDSYNWPTRIDLSGQAMMIPLIFTIDYNDNHTPKTIKALQDQVQLYRLEFEYKTVDITITPPTNEYVSIDPFHFTPGLLSQIKNYDGDDKYLGAFTFDYNFDGKENLKITSLKADGSNNGCFILATDADAKKATFTSYSPDGAVVWYYEYGLDELGNRISEAKFAATGAMETIDSLDIQTLFR